MDSHAMLIKICTQEQNKTIKTVTLLPIIFFQWLPGFEALKATQTVIVLAKTEETAVEKTIPNKTWRYIQVVSVGRPINKNTHRNDIRMDTRRIKLRFLLLAFTIGVLWFDKKTIIMRTVIIKKRIEAEERAIASPSVYDKYSSVLGIHSVLSSFDHSVSKHFMQLSLSVKSKIFFLLSFLFDSLTYFNQQCY